MREQIREELEKFTKIRKGSEEELRTIILTDIIASIIKIETDDKGNKIINYDKFDELISNIKNFINSVDQIPESIDLIENVRQSIENIEKINKECDYCMRTLTWVDSLLEEEENNA